MRVGMVRRMVSVGIENDNGEVPVAIAEWSPLGRDNRNKTLLVWLFSGAEGCQREMPKGRRKERPVKVVAALGNLREGWGVAGTRMGGGSGPERGKHPALVPIA